MIKRIIAVAVAVAATIGIALAPAAAQPRGHSWPGSAATRQQPVKHGFVTDPAKLAKMHLLTSAQVAATTCAYHSTWKGTRPITESGNPNWAICSQDGVSKFIFQTDGNLVLYEMDLGGQAEAATDTNNCCGSYYLALQNDNNLVIRSNNDGHAVWAAGTNTFFDGTGTHHDVMARNDLINVSRDYEINVSLRRDSDNANLGSKNIGGAYNPLHPGLCWCFGRP